MNNVLTCTLSKHLNSLRVKATTYAKLNTIFRRPMFNVRYDWASRILSPFFSVQITFDHILSVFCLAFIFCITFISVNRSTSTIDRHIFHVHRWTALLLTIGARCPMPDARCGHRLLFILYFILCTTTYHWAQNWLEINISCAYITHTNGNRGIQHMSDIRARKVYLFYLQFSSDFSAYWQM